MTTNCIKALAAAAIFAFSVPAFAAPDAGTGTGTATAVGTATGSGTGTAAPGTASGTGTAKGTGTASGTGTTKGTAKKEPTDIPSAVKTGKEIFSAFKGGKFREAIAGIIVLLLFLWRRFASKLIVGKLSPWWTGFVTMLLGYLGAIPEALAVEPWKWSTFIFTGLLTSAEAMLVWSMLGKKLLPKVFGDIPKKDEKKS